MKSAIFCLLALCVTQAVFATDSTDPQIRHPETGIKIRQAADKLEKPFWDAVSAMKPKEKDTDEINTFIGNCLTQYESHNGYFKLYYTATDKCDKCYDKVDKTKNIVVPDKCCDQVVAEFVKATKVNFDQALSCVAKCDKLSADDCLNMLQTLGI